MKLEGTWCTEDFDNEHLQLRVFSTAEKNSFFKFSNERYVVFLERAKEISQKEYELILWKKSGHTISIYEKSLIIDISCSFLYLWNFMKSVLVAFFYI